MPIEVATKIVRLDQKDFHALAERLLGIIFEVHKEFGRFLDEAPYKNEIATRWSAVGLGCVEREIQINVSYGSFRKKYFMDLLFSSGLLLEAKVAEALVSSHRLQGLNYMFLTDMKHSLLVNLRPERVVHEYLSTSLTFAERRRFSFVDLDWREVNDESRLMRQKLHELLLDWGAFLDVNLYREAITHCFGGPDRVVGTVPVYSDGRGIGHQTVHFLNGTTAFAFTASPKGRTPLEDHQRRFLKHTPLQFIQWVNFNRHNIEFTTLTK